MAKLTKKKVEYFIRGEKKAIKEYHPYGKKDKGVRTIEKDEMTHRNFFQRKLKKLRKMS